MENTIDELFNREPSDLTPGDINTLIDYYRKHREGGSRPKKEKGPTAKIDLASLGLAPKTVPAASTFKRRI